MSNATSTTAITALRHIFSNFGLPEHIVSDNGSQFTSEEFQEFLNDNNIQHTTTAPGHPATNGLLERYVGHFKDELRTNVTTEWYPFVKFLARGGYLFFN
jgi:transposase InsO family protein